MKKFRLLSILAVSALLFACNNPDSPSTSSGGANSSTPTSQNTGGTSENSNLVNKTIAELVETAPDDFTTNEEQFLVVEGVWDPTGGDSDQYGNGNLVDPATGKALVIYGMAKDRETYTIETKTPQSGDPYRQMKNPKNYQEVYGTAFNAGDKIKLGLQYSSKYKNYYSYFIEKVADASTFKYDITTEYDNTKGTVTLSKSTGATYGEEITITATAESGYKIKSVKYNGSALTSETAEYKFKVTAINKVEVEFVDENVTTDYGTAEAPISVTAAKQIIKDEGTKNEFVAHDVYVTGVYRVDGSNYYLDDPANPGANGAWIQLWNTSSMNYADGVDKADPHDTIVVHGYIKNYNDSKDEFDVNGNEEYKVIKNTRGMSTITLGNHGGAEVSGIDATSGTTKKNGEEFTFTATANVGLKITSVKAGNTVAEATGNENEYKFTVHGDMEVTIQTADENAPETNYGSKNAPISVEEAMRIVNEECTSGSTENDVNEFYVEGIYRVDGVNYYLDDSSAPGDKSKSIQLYDIKKITYAQDVAAADTHDKIIVHGYIKKFVSKTNVTIEFFKDGEKVYEVVSNVRGTSTITLGNYEGADLTGLDASQTKKNGEEITITVTAKTGKKIVAVLAGSKAANIVAEATGNENEYKFTVHGDMEVTVATAATDAVNTSFNINPTNMLGGDGKTTVSYVSADQTKTIIDGADALELTYYYMCLNSNGGYSLQGNGSKGSYIYNSNESAKEIASIKIIKNSHWTGNGVWNFSFGTSTIATKPSTFAGSVAKIDNNETDVTINCNVVGAKYFRIDLTGGASYVDTIIINYKTV